MFCSPMRRATLWPTRSGREPVGVHLSSPAENRSYRRSMSYGVGLRNAGKVTEGLTELLEQVGGRGWIAAKIEAGVGELASSTTQPNDG